MKIFFGGVLLLIGLCLSAYLVKVDDIPFWEAFTVLIIALTNFGEGLKLSVDYVLDKLQKRNVK